MSPIDTPDKLRDARRQLGLTQGQLAEAIGVSLSLVQKMEQGDTPIVKRTALAVEAMLREHHPPA
jgi:predicted transcriptional regulator